MTLKPNSLFRYMPGNARILVEHRGGLGTIPHGYYSDPDYTADWYTGHVVAVAVDGTKVTDLNQSSQSGIIQTPWFHLGKGLGPVYPGGNPVASCFILRHNFISTNFPPLQYLRLGHFTLLPEYWDVDTLELGITVGGDPVVLWYPIKEDVSHDSPVSPKVSSRHCIGTDNVWLRDKKRKLWIMVEGDLHAVPLLSFKKFPDGKWFCRVVYSLYERDETSWVMDRPDIEGKTITFKVDYEIG